MADIRINALATTAASTASDDFVAVDGSANGTRKLNAFSPSFGGNATVGGNLTVSGTGTSTFGGSVRLPWGTATLLSYFDATYSLGFAFDSTNRKLVLRAQSGDAPANGKGTIAFETGATPSEIARFAPSTGNFLLKSDGVDSGNGKLQLATHTTSAGGIGFGTDTALFRSAAGNLQLSASVASAAIAINNVGSGVTALAYDATGALVYSTGSLRLQTNAGTTALTLDSSQNATFAKKIAFTAQATGTTLVDLSSTDDGTISGYGGNTFLRLGGNFVLQAGNEGFLRISGNSIASISSSAFKTFQPLWLNNAYVGGAPTATGYVTIKDSAGNTYKVLVST